jgi:YD repeat-containing protein
VTELGGDRTSYGYDPTGQLLREHRGGANAYRTTYVYDPAGNRTLEENLVDGGLWHHDV